MTGRGVNLLDLVPERTHAFRENENGTVTVLVPRFGGGRAGRFLQRFVGKYPIQLRLDELGTAVWRLCDGRRSAYEIGACLEEQFGERIDPVFERLGVFLRQMKKAGIIDWRK